MKNIDRNMVIKAGRGGASDFKELAGVLGAKWSPEWEKEIRKAVDGIGDLLYRNLAVRKIQAARTSGNEEDVTAWRKAVYTSTLRFMDAGIPTLAPAMLPSDTAIKEPKAPETKAHSGNGAKPLLKPDDVKHKAAKSKDGFDASKLVPVGEGEVGGKVMPPLVMGYAGKEYHGRKVVAVKRVAGIFGTKAGERGGPQLCTLRDGIVNQCSMKEPPTPYWAALDAASGLKSGFTREQVVDEAMKLLGKGVSRKGVEIAWDVLKNHQYHPRKKDCGMGFVVDQPPGRSSLMSIRPRDEGETQTYFEAQRKRAKEDVRPPRAAGPEPAEAKPVAVLVEKKV